jgi:16S rRNA (cytidine1402-2'-O)-methyltransferase
VAGTLYVVATPIGNLGDLSPRAAQILTGAAAVAAEDTRHSGALLRHLGARAEMISVHAHAPAGALERVLRLLDAGQDVALVTDAGTPAVSDPGATLVARARARGAAVVTVPGPSAVPAALAVSGLPADRYTFLGFLPRKGREACGGDRPAAVARELTKVFEETRAGTLAELAGYYAEAPARGEFTIVVAGTGRPPPVAGGPDPAERARALLASGLSRKDAADQVARETGIPRNTAYRLVNEL